LFEETNGVDRTAKAEPTMIRTRTIAPKTAKRERAMRLDVYVVYLFLPNLMEMRFFEVGKASVLRTPVALAVTSGGSQILRPDSYRDRCA
jgi:hypothetical protein